MSESSFPIDVINVSASHEQLMHSQDIHFLKVDGEHILSGLRIL